MLILRIFINMEDKQIGILWNSIPLAGDDSASYWQSKCAALIRKLVKERTARVSGPYRLPDMIRCQEIALLEFGINPKAYNG